MITLHALLVRRADLTHDEFLAHWRGTHASIIRDTPGLAEHVLSYAQHELLPEADAFGLGGGFDGVTIQTFVDWEAFRAFVSAPEAKLMNDDMANFLDVDGLRVTVTDEPVVVIADESR